MEGSIIKMVIIIADQVDSARFNDLVIGIRPVIRGGDRARHVQTMYNCCPVQVQSVKHSYHFAAVFSLPILQMITLGWLRSRNI